MFFVYHIPHPEEPKDINRGYVGVTGDVVKRFKQHSGSKLIVGKAIRKYKLSISEVVILFEFSNSQEAYAKEFELRPKIKMGWNIGVGGFGGSRGPTSPHVKKIMSEKMSGESNPYFGQKHSNEIRSKISLGLMERDEEWRKDNASNAGKANLGKTRTDESKERYKSSASLRPKFECPHCGKVGQYNSMIAYHGDKCKKKITNNDSGNLLRLNNVKE